MNTFTLVRQEHLNHHGVLFGGQLLLWVDEFTWLTATRDFPGCLLVTRGMDEISFRHQVPSGSILRFHIHLFQKGNTSLKYITEVFADSPGAKEEKMVFSTKVTFVRIDNKGNKMPLPDIPEALPSDKID